MNISSHTIIRFLFLPWLFFSCISSAQNFRAQLKDPIAEKMLIFQRNDGGWPQYHGDRTIYTDNISAERLAQVQKDKILGDATIDDGSTTDEIVYLLKTYQKTENDAYLKAAEHGIEYLFESQNSAGGWPQKFPDLSGYHKHITYNDNAMISVMKIVKDLSENNTIYQPVASALKEKAEHSLQRGIECILKTQYIQNGIKTAWGAQHDTLTLQPASARAFEPISLSGAETVGIVLFLKSLPDQRPEIVEAIEAATAWLIKVAIHDVRVEEIEAPELPRGKDRVVVASPGEVLWARFYDKDSNQPIFMGRDSIRKDHLAEIEPERRSGYAFLGKWPLYIPEVKSKFSNK